MRQVVAYKRLKTMKTYLTVSPKGSLGRLQVVVVSFDWENFDGNNRLSLMGGSRTWRFDCIQINCFFFFHLDLTLSKENT